MCKGKVENNKEDLNSENVIKWLMERYNAKVVPVEKRHSFERFHSPPLAEAEFAASPVIMFLGQYSVGKTSMIKYLCNKDYPGASIGPEPTTDSFVAVHYGKEPHIVQGLTLTEDNRFPFQSLKIFGSAFSSRLQGAALNAPILKHMSFLDTPGILSGEEQTTKRQYGFNQVVRFLCDKVDMVILMFDTTKLDISDELKQVINCLRGNEEKLRIVLNKADMVDEASMIRVRGALMWGLSKVIQTPEVPKVYIGSFTRELKDKSIMNTFKEDYLELFHEIQLTVSRCTSRKVNDLIKRIELVKTHAGLMTIMMGGRFSFSDNEKGMQKMFAADRVKQKFAEFRIKQRKAPADLPDVEDYRKAALETTKKHWVKEDPKLMKNLNDFIENDIPKALAAMKYDELPSDSLKSCFQDLVKAVNEAPVHIPSQLSTESSEEKIKDKKKDSKPKSNKSSKVQSDGDHKKKKNKEKKRMKANGFNLFAMKPVVTLVLLSALTQCVLSQGRFYNFPGSNNYGVVNDFYWDGYQYRSRGNNGAHVDRNGDYYNYNDNYRSINNNFNNVIDSSQLDQNRNRMNGCRDGGTDCAKSKHLCEDNTYRSFMAVECPLTCGKC
ncbi:unnamed protein product [Bursaphelenchus xylophilus]|uniref:(pine wood nematode) hypothetical protein n=1 Tax=Bursaphelenchus xylophilus TaxID=6326 RepID=A0A1I7RMW7_BURXY|nr:unnamed protein product [Bursaphelenchus xylophilus]CAG9125388.1 unnamed protein product [Bursaphelenchus xylophilus]